jgi:PAS domain S-box-containing protein
MDKQRPKKKTAKKPPSLRKRAEQMLVKQKERLQELASTNLKKLVHELGTHQIELEMQNEELRRSQAEIETSRRKYADLFDFSPVGYFTFDKSGLIREVNHTGAGMLGFEKRSLIAMPIQNFIEPDDRTVFRKHLSEVFNTQIRQTCELNLRGKKGVMFPVQLQSICADSGNGILDSCRTAFSNISERRKAEAEARRLDKELQRVLLVERELREAELRRERRQIKEDLRVSKEQYQRLFESSLDAVFLMKPDGTIISVNAAACRLLDMTAFEIYSAGRSSILDPTDLRVLSLIAERKHDGFTRDEIDLIRKDGTRVPCDVSSVQMRDTEGKAMISIVAHDITERRDTQEHAKILNEILKLFTESLSRGEYLESVCDKLRHWTGCSHVGVRIARPDNTAPFDVCDGYDEVFLKQERELSLADNQCICSRVITGTSASSDLAAMTENGSFYTNNSLLFEDGLADNEKRLYRGTCMRHGFRSLAVIPIRYGGRLTGAVHLADQRENMVPLKKVEYLEHLGYIIGEAVHRFNIEEERVRMASALEFAADGVVITEPLSGAIKYVNRALEKMTGYAKEELIGRTIHLFDSGRQGGQFYQELRETLRHDDLWRGQMVSKKKDGTLFFEDCMVYPVKGPAGEILDYVTLKRDITEKLRLESIAESVNTMESIGYIFSGVRHEIGNPINAVNMILGILSYKLPALSQEAIREYLDRIAGQIERVEFLLSSLKSFNMYETQEPQTVVIASFIQQFMKLVKDGLEAKGIAFEVMSNPQADRLHADPRALQQVLLNLITNATDAVQKRDHPRIAMRISRLDHTVLIGVEDNGYGIPEDRVKELFKPFYTTKVNGTGLGLVIVKKMITRMNGTIAVKSTKDVGTVVTISLPEGTRDGN